MERTLLSTLADNTLDLIYVKDREGRFTFVNSMFLEIVGASSRDEVLGKTDFDFNQPELAQGYHDDDQQVMRSGKPLPDREEIIFSVKTGESRWYSTTKVPLQNEAGEIVGIVGITRDITSAKQAELEVRQLNAELE